jgi:hypothetical protein
MLLGLYIYTSIIVYGQFVYRRDARLVNAVFRCTDGLLVFLALAIPISNVRSLCQNNIAFISSNSL